ncbi:hypothetical protein D3C81_2174690 [compost metagenome]
MKRSVSRFSSISQTQLTSMTMAITRAKPARWRSTMMKLNTPEQKPNTATRWG